MQISRRSWLLLLAAVVTLLWGAVAIPRARASLAHAVSAQRGPVPKPGDAPHQPRQPVPPINVTPEPQVRREPPLGLTPRPGRTPSAYATANPADAAALNGHPLPTPSPAPPQLPGAALASATASRLPTVSPRAMPPGR